MLLGILIIIVLLSIVDLKKTNGGGSWSDQYRNSKYGFLGIIPIFLQKENNCEETLKPYLAYFVSYPKSDFLNKNPENIEIFGPQNYIANTVAQANQNRNVGYVYDDAS